MIASTIAFGRGDVVDGDEQVGDELHLRPGAEGADVVVRAREPLEHRRDPPAGRAVPARVDDEILRPRLGAGSAQRTIEEQSRRARARARRACSFTAIGSVLVSTTIAAAGRGGQRRRSLQQGVR